MPAKINPKIHISFLSLLLVNVLCTHDAHAGVNEYRLGYNYKNRKVQFSPFGFVGFGLFIMFLFYDSKPKIIESTTDIEFQETTSQPILNGYNIINQNSQLNTETIFFLAFYNKKNIASIKLLFQKPPATNPLINNPLCIVDGLVILNEYEAQDAIIINACLNQIITYATEKKCQSITITSINEEANKNKMPLIKKIFEASEFVLTNNNNCQVEIYKKQLLDVTKKNNRLST